MGNDKNEISKCDLKLLAYKLLPEIKKYFADEKIQKEFQEWIKKIIRDLTNKFYKNTVITRPLHKNMMFVFGLICSTIPIRKSRYNVVFV